MSGGGSGGGGAAAAAPSAAQLWRAGQRAMQSGDLGTALGVFQAAQAADPSHAGVWLSTAVALGAAGQPDKACVCLALAVDAARAAEAEAAAAGPGAPLPAWPSTIAAVASSNLYSLARKHSLCTAELPERLCDAAFAAHAAAAVAREATLAVAACGGGGGGGAEGRLLRVVLERPSGAEASAVGRAAVGAVAAGGWRVEVVSRHPSEFMTFVDGNVEKEEESGAVYRTVVAGEEEEEEEEGESNDDEEEERGADVVLRVPGACGFPLLMQAGLWGGGAAAAAAAPQQQQQVRRRCGRCELWGRLVSSRDLRLLETVDAGSVERATGLRGLGEASSGLRGCVRPVDAAQWRVEAASTPTRLLEDLPDGFLEEGGGGVRRLLPQLSLVSDVAFGGGGGLTGVLVWEEHVVDGVGADRGAEEASRYSLRAGERGQEEEEAAGGASPVVVPPHSRWQYMLYAGEDAAPSLHRDGVAAGGSVAFTLAVQGGSREISVAFAGEEQAVDEEKEQEGAGEPSSCPPPPLRLPPYHAVMLNDEQRTLAYLKGLQEVQRRFEADAAAAPAPPPSVVDLGAGTGLLSLLAAKAAGFERVYAVERFEEMARIAQRVIEANDASASVTLLAKHSSDLTAEDFGGARGAALPAAGVLVHEIFGTDPLSEGLLPAYNAAVKQGLVDASTVFCPSRFRVHAAVGSSATLMAKAGRRGGGRWGPVPCVVPRKLEEDLAKVSDVVYATEPRVVWDVQLDGRPLPLTGAKEVALRVAAGGTTGGAAADLVFYWFDFLCGDSQWYSTAPQPGAATPVAHWVQNIEVLDRPVLPEEGTGVYRLVLAWNADRVMFVHPRRKPVAEKKEQEGVTAQ